MPRTPPFPLPPPPGRHLSSAPSFFPAQRPASHWRSPTQDPRRARPRAGASGREREERGVLNICYCWPVSAQGLTGRCGVAAGKKKKAGWMMGELTRGGFTRSRRGALCVSVCVCVCVCGHRFADPGTRGRACRGTAHVHRVWTSEWSRYHRTAGGRATINIWTAALSNSRGWIKRWFRSGDLQLDVPLEHYRNLNSCLFCKVLKGFHRAFCKSPRKTVSNWILCQML